MITTRRKYPAFGWGKLLWINHGEPAVATWIRYYGESKVLVVSNTASVTKSISIQIPPEFHPFREVITLILTGGKFYTSKEGKLDLTLEPYEFIWFDLDPLIL